MSGEKSGKEVDERALSLEEVFLSAEFGQVHHAEDVVDGPTEPPEGRSDPAVDSVGPTSRRRRNGAVGAVSGIAAALVVALGLATATGKGTPDKPNGGRGAAAAQAAGPVPSVGPVAPAVSAVGQPAASTPTADALAATTIVPSSAVPAVRTSAPAQVDYPTPPTAAAPTPTAPTPAPTPTPAPMPAATPPAASGPAPAPRPPASVPGDLVAAATQLIESVVTSAGNTVAGLVSNLGTTVPPLPKLPPLPASPQMPPLPSPPSLPSVVGTHTASPFGPH